LVPLSPPHTLLQSPERIKKEIVEMNHAVEREQKNLVGSERRVRELTLRVEGVTQIDGDVERGIKELTEVASEIGRLKKTRVSCILKPHLPPIQHPSPHEHAQ